MNFIVFLSATIWQCISAQGDVTFTDRPCPGNEQSSNAEQAPLILLAPLSSHAMQRVAEIDRLAEQRQQASKRKRVQAHRSKIKSETARRQGCEQTLVQLRKLRARKRKGYSLAEASDLAQKETELRQLRRQLCY